MSKQLKVNSVLKKYAKSLFFKMLFVCVIYGIMINEFLYNRADGIWSGTYHLAGDWALSLGRWAIRYIDLAHFGISVYPLSAIITLLLFVLGTCFLVDLFNIEISSIWDYLISGLFLANMIICISISYLYTSSIFGLSFATSSLCMWFVSKGVKGIADFRSLRKVNVFASLLGASVCVVIVLGAYQAYLGCLALMALLYLVYLVNHGFSFAYIRNYFLGGAVSGIIGFAIYEMILKIELSRYGVEMSSYNGANSLSVRNIVSHLPSSMKRAYEIFLNYLVGKGSRWNLFAGNHMLIVFLAMCLVYVVLVFMIRKKILRTVICLFSMILIPVAANIVVILIPDSQYLGQQTAPCALGFPIIICILARQLSELHLIQIKKVCKMVVVAISVIIMWGSIYQVQIDQEAMRQGVNTARTISSSILVKLYDEDLYSTERRYAIIGSPCNNPMVCLNEIYFKSNPYARVSGAYWGTSLDSRTWGGIFKNLLGINLPRCSDAEYERLLTNQRVTDMPLFPAKESIQEIDGVVVIRVS